MTFSKSKEKPVNLSRSSRSPASCPSYYNSLCETVAFDSTPPTILNHVSRTNRLLSITLHGERNVSDASRKPTQIGVFQNSPSLVVSHQVLLPMFLWVTISFGTVSLGHATIDDATARCVEGHQMDVLVQGHRAVVVAVVRTTA